MVLAIHGVNNKNKKISLSNYSLATQIIIINLITAIIGFFIVIFINYFLLSNNNTIDQQIEEITNDLDRINTYLGKNAIIRIPQFNTENCELGYNNNKNDCGDKIFSNPQLDPTLTQNFLLDNYLYNRYQVKIYDDSLIKFADTGDIFISEDVVEIENRGDLYNLDIFISGEVVENAISKEWRIDILEN